MSATLLTGETNATACLKTAVAAPVININLGLTFCRGSVIRGVLYRNGEIQGRLSGNIPKICSDIAMAVYLTGVSTIC